MFFGILWFIIVANDWLPHKDSRPFCLLIAAIELLVELLIFNYWLNF